MTNALAYYTTELITAVQSFTVQALGVHVIKTLSLFIAVLLGK
jgi:hypothetical protein